MSPIPNRAQLRRDEILESAERIIAHKGYHAAGIADIAADLKIGHGTFYRYFKNKEDVALKVLDRIVARMAAAGLAEDPESSDTLEEYRDQVARILEGMLRFAEAHPTLMRFFHIQAAAIDPGFVPRVLDRYVEFTARFLRNGITKGFLRPGLDVPPTAQAMVGLIFEGTRRVLDEDDEKERRRFIDASMKLLFDGIGESAGTTSTL